VALDNRLFYKINIAQRVLFKQVDRETKERFGVSSTQLATLFYLLKNDGCFLKSLSKEFFQNKSAITTLVERMEKNHLLKKKSSTADGRAFQIFITPKGREIGLRALELLSDLNVALTDGFSMEEIEIVHRFLNGIINKYSVSD
jgi:DNA-binding MarR family transcriptional regulator